VRDPARAAALLEAAGRLGVHPLLQSWAEGLDVAAEAELLVSTTPAGSTDELARRLPSRVGGTLFEVVYDPWPTPLAAAWQARGGQVIGGLDLLVHQAVLQVALMTGLPVDVPALVPVLRSAGERALRTA
jgi:shikimate dehydrogenase